MRRHDDPPPGSLAHPRSRQRGATIVEFAITASFSIGLLFLIIEFGIAMFNQGLLMHAARVGARVASLYWENPASLGTQALSPTTRIEDRTKDWANMVVRLTNKTPQIRICWYAKGGEPNAAVAANTACPVDLNLNSQPPVLPTSGVKVQAGDMVMVRTGLAYSGPISQALNGFGLNLTLGSLAVMRVE